MLQTPAGGEGGGGGAGAGAGTSIYGLCRYVLTERVIFEVLDP